MKTHLAFNLMLIPYCTSTRRLLDGRILHAVRAKAFKALPALDRCSHCETIFLHKRNQQRRKKGLQPVSHMND